MSWLSGSTRSRRFEQRPLPGDLGHQLVDIFELLQRRPAGIARAPVRARPQPHREGLGEILVRMALRVPEPQVLDEIPARRIGPVIGRIASRRWAEQLLPAAAAMELIGVLDHMAGFVAEDAHAFGPGAALDVEDDLLFELHQARMRKIERKGDAGRRVGAEPLAGNPRVGLHPDVALGKLLVQRLQAVLEPGALQRQLEITKAQLEQLIVRQVGPGKCLAWHEFSRPQVIRPPNVSWHGHIETLVDRHNHHLFQPLLYQVATAGLSPGRHRVSDPRASCAASPTSTCCWPRCRASTSRGRSSSRKDGRAPLRLPGARDRRTHAYFGHDEWEPLRAGPQDPRGRRSRSAAASCSRSSGRARDRPGRAAARCSPSSSSAAARPASSWPARSPRSRAT